MHKDFQQHLRVDGLGIDYSFLLSYDTETVIRNYLFSQHPYWIKFCNDAISKKKRNLLNECLSTAPRIRLDSAHPELMEKVNKALSQL
jgi:hypothetical protein